MIAEAARLVVGGGVVVYPTETVYGLGANALDEQAILRVYKIKRRPLSMPVFMAISSLEMLTLVAELNEEELSLAGKLLPGPVSLLVRKRSIVPDVLTAGSPMVGIRYPDHETALRIIDRAGPITSTSANRTGSPPPASADAVAPEIARMVDLVLEGGECRYKEPSTLLDLASRKIIRPGAGLEDVLKAIS